jgi:hypothetical protein
MALFRVDYSGRGELSERQQKVSDLSLNDGTFTEHQDSLDRYEPVRIFKGRLMVDLDAIKID